MLSPLVPAWAPNLHPLVVHFPIAWLTAALILDLISLALPRTAWAETMADVLYPTGAIAAWVTCLSGRQAAATVLTPGMAHALVLDHWNWALATTIVLRASQPSAWCSSSGARPHRSGPEPR